MQANRKRFLRCKIIRYGYNTLYIECYWIKVHTRYTWKDSHGALCQRKRIVFHWEFPVDTLSNGIPLVRGVRVILFNRHTMIILLFISSLNSKKSFQTKITQVRNNSNIVIKRYILLDVAYFIDYWVWFDYITIAIFFNHVIEFGNIFGPFTTHTTSWWAIRIYVGFSNFPVELRLSSEFQKVARKLFFFFFTYYNNMESLLDINNVVVLWNLSNYFKIFKHWINYI